MFDTVGRRTDAGAWVYSKLTYEPSAHASLKGFSWCICLIHVYSSDWPSTLKMKMFDTVNRWTTDIWTP